MTPSPKPLPLKRRDWSLLPDPGDVRQAIEDLLHQLRANDGCPWSEELAARWFVAVPNLTNWLDSRERDRLRSDWHRATARFLPPPAERPSLVETAT